jgi:hypothetical protein
MKTAPSRTPAARKARRVLRTYLRYSMIATAKDVPEDIRKDAFKRADKLEHQLKLNGRRAS